MADSSPPARPDRLVLSLLRPQDLLSLEFEFFNLELQTDPDRGARLVRADPQAPAYFVVHFAPQSIAEEAFFETDAALKNVLQENPNPDSGKTDIDRTTADAAPAPPPIRARIAGRSRLAFVVPPDVGELAPTLDALLDWARYELSVAPTALPHPPEDGDLDPRPPIAAPAPWETAIEMPYRLLVSPSRREGWTHATVAVTRAGRTELWHTRLGVRVLPPAPEDPSAPAPPPAVDESGSAGRPILRAVWSPDYSPSAPPAINDLTPFRTSLTRNDRHQLVRLTSDYNIVTQTLILGDRVIRFYYDPKPVDVERMMLTSQGAYLRSRGAWDLPDRVVAEEDLDLQEWRHIAALARDHYVRVVYRGFLYPFGHRASLIKITERKIQDVPSGPQKGTPAAYLRQRMFIVVREPEKTYEGAPYVHGGRENPFSPRVRITTLVTPNIDPPEVAPSAIADGIFWVQVGGQDFKFHVVVTDVEGQTSEFTASMIFIRGAKIDTSGAAVSTYRAAPDERRRCAVPGQRVAYARREPSKAGETSLATEGLFFDTDPIAGVTAALNFLPKLAKAEVRVPAVEQLVGPKPIAIEPYQGYLVHGLTGDQNKAELFAKILGTPKLPFPSQKAGGLATPTLELSGLSQTLGPIAGELEDLRKGDFRPEKFFNLLDEAKLLGCISLKDLIEGFTSLQPFDPGQLPKMLTDTVRSAAGVPEQVTTTLDWKPKVKAFGPFETKESANPDERTSFEIVARLSQKLGAPPSEPDFRITGDLRNFAINFLGVVRVNFTSLSFLAEKNKKLDVSANLVKEDEPAGKYPVEFLGALEFVNKLREFIPSDGFKDPPFLDVGPSGVDVGFSLALPPLAVGVFSLQNVALGARLHLPFDAGRATLRFNFAERHQPFLLTVSLFGGGGFFALAVAIDKPVLVEAALEFGGNISLDLGVASGGVYVMAGIYFKLAESITQLSGYVRCGGHLSVLGLITVSLEFYLELSYINGKARGRATLTVKVEVLFFSTSVELTVERTFGGSSGDPVFGDTMSLANWVEYGEAFA